jgi:GTP-binding protein LepA
LPRTSPHKCYGRRDAQAQALGRSKTKQDEGKKRMRQFGKADNPQEAFIAALKVDV